MAKTHKHLYPQICDFDNLYRARQARANVNAPRCEQVNAQPAVLEDAGAFPARRRAAAVKRPRGRELGANVQEARCGMRETTPLKERSKRRPRRGSARSDAAEDGGWSTFLQWSRET